LRPFDFSTDVKILNFTAKTQRPQRKHFLSFAAERAANEKRSAYGRNKNVN
jgi:hypothetical protein